MDSVGQYLNDIGRHRLLTPEEERELSQVIARGRHAATRLSTEEVSPTERRRLQQQVRDGTQAKERFINANLRLVVSIAKRYPTNTVDFLDLIQEGNLGLEHAVDKFEWERGFKFSTYATFWIRQAIGRAFDRQSTVVTVPGGRTAELRACLRHSDSDNIPEGLLSVHQAAFPVSLDRPVGDDETLTFGEVIPDLRPDPESEALTSVAAETVRSVLGSCSEREREAIELRFGLRDGRQRSYADIGDHLGVSTEMARRIVTRGLVFLRRHRGDLIVLLPEMSPGEEPVPA